MFKKKSPLKAVRLVKRKRRLRILKIIGLILACGLFVYGISWLSWREPLQIREIKVEGNSGIDSNEVKATAEAELVGSYLGMFPKTNRFLYPKQKIMTAIVDKFKRVKELNLSTEVKTLTITITERTPAYFWCTGNPTDTEKRVCYFTDNDGYIFAEAPIFSGNAFFAYYGLIKKENPIGLAYLDLQELSEVNSFINHAKNAGLDPIALFGNENGVYELYLTDLSKVMFTKDQDPEVLNNNLDAVLKSTSLFSAKQVKQLEYLDLRFGNKVYYKFAGDNNIEPVE